MTFRREHPMPQYAVIHHHPPDNCPIANKAVRAFAQQAYANLPKLEQELGVKTVLNIHLDPGHKALMVLEAPTAEAARDLLVRGGFMHFTDMEFHLVTPIAEILQYADQFPTIY
jgi:hypothetical protein